MRFLRNPQVRFVFITDAVIFIASIIASLIMVTHDIDVIYIITLFIAAMLISIIIFMISSYRHYKKVADFAEKLDKNLHGSRDLNFDEYQEGDFSVLEDTVNDMLLAHYHQEDELRNDKVMLAQALADISHQIKTPLAAITLTAERLDSDDIDPFERKLLTHRMLDLISRISSFVTTLLKISRLDADVVKFRQDSFTAKELISQSVEPIEAVIELHCIQLKTDIPEGIIIAGDKMWLAEAFTNIIKNCIEHTPDGGKIFINVTENPIYTEFVIRDTGIGIEPEDLPHIFERYYKGKNSGSNSIGIGLAFTQMVIHSLGGTIKAENHPEAGAVFTVRMIKKNV